MKQILVVVALGAALSAAAQTPVIKPESQLMIIDRRVVADPLRTNPLNGSRAPWTFRYLIENMAGPNNPSDFVMKWLTQWEANQTINGSVAPARPSIRQLVIDPWLKASGGQRLDLNKAPFQLLAIVNRLDLHVRDGDKVTTAGEGRFVFGVLGADGKPLPPLFPTAPGGFTVIFEYELIATNTFQLRDWAQQWTSLGNSPVGSPMYNDALERITRRFTDRGRAPGKPNGNALNQVRSNELALGLPWELREFGIVGGFLRQRGVAQTPDVLALNGTPALANLINANEAALLNETYVLPAALRGAAALAGPFQLSDFPGASNRTFTAIELIDPFYDVPWSAAGIINNDARHAFGLNTCGGCHRTETGAGFLQVGFPATNGAPAALAGFLTGITVPDPLDPATPRTFNDLERRRQDLADLLASFAPNQPRPMPRHVPNFVH
ncbi:MAG: hypothetical protein WCS70_10920 [Verrucomicrobiota bacterium]